MKILDTDILIGFLRKNQDAINKIIELKTDDMVVTVFGWQELLFGPAVTENKEEYKVALELLESYELLNYEKSDAFYAVKILTHLKKGGSPIGLVDVMIAAICLRSNAVLVTRNVEHFSRIPGLKVEKW